MFRTLGIGDRVIVLNDRPTAVGASPLRRQDSQGNDSYMVSNRKRIQFQQGLVPETDRGWIRNDFLSISCPP